MNTKHEDRSLDAVLFRFHREVSAPTPEIVAAWRREYPEHASEIEAHAMEVLDVESRAGAEVSDMASLETKARSAALNAVFEAKRRGASARACYAQMLDKETLDRWREWSRQDDWHQNFIGSDIRQMLGEIDRLKAERDKWKKTAFESMPSMD